MTPTIYRNNVIEAARAMTVADQTELIARLAQLLLERSGRGGVPCRYVKLDARQDSLIVLMGRGEGADIIRRAAVKIREEVDSTPPAR